MGKLIGIDLGTTNSCVAVMEGGVPKIIPNQEGAGTTPSIVGFTAKGERLVGQIAKRQALTNPKNTVFAVKRLMGRKFNSNEVETARRFMPFQIAESRNGDAHIQIEEKVYSPPEISSFILAKLKAAAEDYLAEPVDEAVITVPAYFSDPQRQATKDAGIIAGFKVSRIINAPTAAALTYGLKSAPKSPKGRVAVYSLGGGTFDISILEMADGLVQVKATCGDTFLGGEDFDQRVIDWLIAEFLRETGIDLRQDRMALQRLKEAAEKAKCKLSTAQQTDVVLPFISADASGPKHLNTVLTRQKYESLTYDLLERTIDPCRLCLLDAGLRANQIDEVLLVGGHTRAPKVSELVRKVFGKEANRAVNHAGVAMGAAIMTGIIHGEVKDLVVLDVTPHTLGIETKGSGLMTLIDRNSTIPTRTSRVFTTVADNQTRVEMHVLQKIDMAVDEKSLAKVELTNIPPAPKGVPQVEVSFEIDVHGIVSVSAQDQATGRSQAMTIHPSGGLSQQEVSRLATDARAVETAERGKKDRQEDLRQWWDRMAKAGHIMDPLPPEALTWDEQDRLLVAMVSAKKAKQGVVWPGPVEQELLVKRRGLMVKVRSLFETLDCQLTEDEREQVLGVIDGFETVTDGLETVTGGGVDELRGCVETLEGALRLLEAVRFRS